MKKEVDAAVTAQKGMANMKIGLLQKLSVTLSAPDNLDEPQNNDEITTPLVKTAGLLKLKDHLNSPTTPITPMYAKTTAQTR